jgi:transmembrane sensor
MDKFTKQAAQELLRRYRKGLCTDEEIELINRWYNKLDQEDANKDFAQDADYLSELKAAMLESIGHRIDDAPGSEVANKGERPVKQRFLVSFSSLRRVAAVLLVGLAVGLFLYIQNYSFHSQTPATKEARNDADRIEGEVADAAAATTLYLSDGSVVWLKDASRLEYPEKFDGNSREVTLVGEAFFDIAPNKDKPFIIHSANFTTRVLGTSFNIKAYGDHDAQEVVVVTGRVVVSVKGSSDNNVQELVLTPNQKAIYSRKRNLLSESPVEQNESSALRKEKLVFDETSVRDIIKVLNAAHHSNIIAENESMNACLITADLTDEGLEASIGILAKAINATVKFEGEDILLSGTGCGVKE